MSAAEQLADVMRDVEQCLRAETDTAARLAKSLVALKVARLVVRAAGGDEAEAVSLAFGVMRGADGAHEEAAVSTLLAAGVDAYRHLRVVEDRERDREVEEEHERQYEREVPWGGDV